MRKSTIHLKVHFDLQVMNFDLLVTGMTFNLQVMTF